MPVCDVRNSNKVNFGAFFWWKQVSKENENWIVLFFEEKINLKHLKTGRPSDMMKGTHECIFQISV